MSVCVSVYVGEGGGSFFCLFVFCPYEQYVFLGDLNGRVIARAVWFKLIHSSCFAAIGLGLKLYSSDF